MKKDNLTNPFAIDPDVLENWDKIPKKNADWDKQDDRYTMNPTTTTAYIPTTFIVPPKIEVGEFWYIKYLGSRSLVEVEIKEVSQKTVLLKQVDRPYDNPVRYEKSDIKFVEKVEKV